MRRALPFLLLLVPLLAAACATPRQSCIAAETRDLRVVERLIARDRATLDRGYALREETRFRPVLQVCAARSFDGHLIGTSACLRPEPRTRVVPVAVDLAAVRDRLEGLLDKRAELAARAEAGVAACRAAHPAG